MLERVSIALAGIVRKLNFNASSVVGMDLLATHFIGSQVSKLNSSAIEIDHDVSCRRALVILNDDKQTRLPNVDGETDGKDAQYCGDPNQKYQPSPAC